MFSKIDIQRSLGKSIAFFPFNEDLIKENSLNLTVSSFGWTLTEVSQETLEEVSEFEEQEFGKGKSCSVMKEGRNYILLFPFSTTIVITQEFLAVNNSIGGTLHTRVGTAADGVAHISTMLGPSYMGRLTVPVHNPTNEIISLPVGSPFLSLVFYHLRTSSKETNHTLGAHREKFAQWNIALNEEELKEIHYEKLKTFENYTEEMGKDEAFKKYKKENSWWVCFKRSIKDWSSLRDVMSFLVFIVSILLLILSFFVEDDTNDWMSKIRESLITVIVIIGLGFIPNENK